MSAEIKNLKGEINLDAKKEFKEIKFNHLMSIYELNYHNLKRCGENKYAFPYPHYLT